MRNILILCAVILVAGAAALVWRLTRPEHFGPPFQHAQIVSIQDLLEKPAEHLGHTVTVEGVINRQCPVTGCWLYIMDASGRQIRAELSSIALTFPQRGGGVAIVEGKLVKKGDSYEIDGKAVRFK